jgi:hypothetical protein
VHLIFRPHEDPNAVVVEAETRSFKKVDPFCLRWDFPLWVLAPDLAPILLKRARTPKPKAQDKPPDPAEAWDAEKFAEAFLAVTPKKRTAIIDNAHEAGLTYKMAERLLDSAESKGKAHCWKVPGSLAHHYANQPQPPK